MKVHYKLETFEGPLDLLLHLIEKAEVDIYDIPVSEITDQYMAYLQTMQEFELEVTSEFLVMAATLLSLKSKMLLPKPPAAVLELTEEGMEADDPRAELVQKLIEYRKFKQIAEQLREKEVARSLIYTREPEDLSAFIPDAWDSNPLEGLFMADLALAFQKVLKRLENRDISVKIPRDEISVKDRMNDVLTVLRERDGGVLFSELFAGASDRQEVVVTFLALLELIKRKWVTCFQHGLFDDIVIRNRGEAHGLWTDEIDY